jgi:hypothetical protein
MSSKPTKTREELVAAILARLKDSPECRTVAGVVIAPVLKSKSGYAKWHAAFTMKGGETVPAAAWRIEIEVASEFDLV